MNAPSGPLTPAEILQGLNAQQQKAVKYCDGPLLVIAGPGTGKTRVITEKVLYLVAQHGFHPGSILALTFTKKATAEMAERIQTRLAQARLPGQPYIGTFHSFCFDLITEFGYGSAPGQPLRLLTGAFFVQFLLDHLDHFPIQHSNLIDKSILWCETLADFLSRCHDEGLLDQNLEQCFQQWLQSPNFGEDPARCQVVLDLIRAIPVVRQKQQDFGVVTFGDLLTLAVQLLKNSPSVLRELQARYQYILVDEFQDNNTVQFELVNLLAADHRRILVVGDEDQCIYRFRGAGLDLIKRFRKHWGRHAPVIRLNRGGHTKHRQAGHIAAKPAGHLETVMLEENYRSTDAIINVFTTLIQNNQRRLGQKQLRRAGTSPNHGPDHVVLMHFPTDDDERLWIVEKIRALLQPSNGNSPGQTCRKPGDIAILCRSLNHVGGLVRDLRAAGFAVEVVGETGLFGDAIVRETLAWLFTLDDPLEEEISLHRVLRFHGFGLTYADQYAISQAAKQAGKPLMVLIEELGKNPLAAINGLSERGHGLLRKFAELHKDFRIETQAQSSPDLVETVHRVARYAGLHAFLDPDTPAGRRHLNAFRGLLDLAQQYQNYYPNPSLHGFVGFLKLLEGLGHDETVGEPSGDPDSIKVMTVHQAKGQEFPVVFVGGLADRFPSQNRREMHRKFLDFLTLNGNDPQAVHQEEERRVLYVALSRAKEELILSSYDCRGESRRQRNGRFLEEIEQSSAVRKTRHKGYAGSTAQGAAVQQAPGKTVEDALFHQVSWLGRQLGRDDLPQYFRTVLELLGGLMADMVGEEQVRQALAALGLPPDLAIRLPQPDKPVAPKGTLRLMPTSLELYRKCPRQYYYKHVAEIPEPERRAARFGTAVHKALERLHRKHPRLSIQLKAELLQYFKEELQAVSFSSDVEKQQAIEQGEEVLTRFLEEEADLAQEIKNTEVEKDLRLSLDHDILLSMRIDRLDTLSDGSVRVLDYKTGKLASGPEYLRQFQMPCYALAVQEVMRNKLSRIEVVGLKKLHDNGQTERKILPWDGDGTEKNLSPKRLAQLQQEIQEIAAAIRAGQFEARPDEDTCRYCSYRRLCDKAAV